MRGPTVDVFTNQWACFDHGGPVGDGYILAIGDSTTWGFGALEDKWTTRLEDLSGRRVLKCGVSGTGPKYQIVKAHKTIARVGVAPEIILVAYDQGNDLNDDVAFPNHDVVDGHRGTTLKSLDLRTGELVRYSRAEVEANYRAYLQERDAFDPIRFLRENLTTAATFLHVLEGLAMRIAPAGHGAVLDAAASPLCGGSTRNAIRGCVEAYEEHLETLRSLHELAAQYDAELVLITDDIENEGLRADLRQFVAAEFPHHVDVGPPMAERAEGRRIRYQHDSHWNALGNRLAGEIVHEYLNEAGLL